MPITQPKIHTEATLWTRSGNSYRVILPGTFAAYQASRDPIVTDVDGVKHYFNPEHVEHATYREFDANVEAK